MTALFKKQPLWGMVIYEITLKGLSRGQIAAEAGVNRKTIYNWEHGSTEPTYSVACRLLNTYKTLYGSTDKKCFADLS